MAAMDGTNEVREARAADVVRELRRLKPQADVLRFFEGRPVKTAPSRVEVNALSRREPEARERRPFTKASDLRSAFRGIVAKAVRS